jgi:hypothetical protein
VEAIGRLFGGIRDGDHDPGVVERHVEPAESGCRLLDDGGDLILRGDVAGQPEDLVAGGGSSSVAASTADVLMSANTTAAPA